MKKHNGFIITLIVALVVGAGAFFAGVQYQKGKAGTPTTMQGRFQGQTGRTGTFQMRTGNAGGQAMQPVAGEILSADDKSITVKMQDGSSKIIILSDNTKINKTSEGSKSDLTKGEKVTAFGTTNSDGSITAQNISLGQVMMFGGMRQR